MLTTPIVEGAYYEREDGSIHRAHSPIGETISVGHDAAACYYISSGNGYFHDTPRLTRRVYIVPTDPAGVVASLRDMAAMVAKVKAMSESQNRVARLALEESADLVAEKLGVKP